MGAWPVLFPLGAEFPGDGGVAGGAGDGGHGSVVPGTLHSQRCVLFDQAVCSPNHKQVEAVKAVSQTTPSVGFDGCVSICSLHPKPPVEKI